MSVAPFLWIFAPLVAGVFALLLFARKRRRTGDFAEGQAFKATLPWWVGTIERLVALGSGSLLAIVAWKLSVRLIGAPPSGRITSPEPVYVLLGIGAIILPLALLCANVVSWIVPPLRTANERALRGNGLSFSAINRELIKGALVSALAGLALIGVAAIKPWLW